MLKVSDKFKKACNSDSCKYREYIIIDGKQVDIKGNLDATAYKDTTFFGTFNMKMLTFQTENDIDYKKKEFSYYIEVDGESAKIGTFIVTEVKDSDTFEQVNVTAYDYGLKFANPYITNLDYASGKITMYDVIQEICTNCDVEFENATLPNGNFIVDSNQFINNEQYGDVVAMASLENGMFATINENDKLEFIFTKSIIGSEKFLTTENGVKILTENDDFIVVNDLEIIEDYVELDDKRDTQPITSVLVATNEELESSGAVRKDQNLIAKYGEHWLKIYDYAFAYSSEKCEQLIDAIFNQVKEFGYSAFESDYAFKPYLQLGDRIKFQNKNGELINTVILRINKNYDNITLSAPSIISASVEYSLPETAEEKAERAIIEVNKTDAKIALKVSKNEVVSAINLSPEEIKINSNKLSFEGSTFDLTADDISIVGERLEINSDGKILLTDEGARTPDNPNASYEINSEWEEYLSEDEYNKLNASHVITSISRTNTYVNENTIQSSTGYGITSGGIYETLYRYPSTTWEYDGISTTVSCTGITTPTLTQTSQKENKKNFEKFENALQELDKIDIYKYHLKSENDDDKKHLGFVIGEDFKYSELVTSQDNKGVDSYSFISLCFQMIKEQQKQIEELKKEISKLKGDDKNG